VPASKLAGCPDWDEFANGALRLFVDHGKFSHARLDQIDHLRPRIKLSIALALQAESKISIDFRALLHRQERREHAIGRRLYSHLSNRSLEGLSSRQTPTSGSMTDCRRRPRT
jgi:hypothetical protein